MGYLMKKMRRDFWSFKVQFIAVIIMALVSVMVFMGLEGLWYAMEADAEEWMEKSNTADLWAYGIALDDDDLKDIKSIAGIKEIQGEYNITANLREPDDKGQLLIVASDKNNISQPTVQEGSKYSATGNGIWLYDAFAEKHDINVGDDIIINYEGNTLTLVVKGLVVGTEYMSYSGSSTTLLPDRYHYGYAYVSVDTMEELTNESLFYSHVKIVVGEDGDKSIEKIRADVENVLGTKYAGLLERGDFQGISVFVDAAKSFESLSILFSAVFILLSLLTINTTMKRLIDTQRIQIGTLKAIGYSNRAIRTHYALYGFLTSFLGTVIGYLITPFTVTNMLIEVEREYYTLPVWRNRNSWMSLVLIAIIVVGCTITTIMACESGIKGMPAEAMRDKGPKNRKAILLERVKWFWKPLSHEWKWILREMFKNKGRSLIGIVAVIGSISLLMAGLGVSDSLSVANHVLYGEQLNYGSKIVLSGSATNENRLKLLEDANEDAQWVQEATVEIRTSKQIINSGVQIFELGYFTHFENDDNEKVNLPEKGIAVSRLFAAENDLSKGDTVQIRLNGQLEYTMVSIGEILGVYAPQGIYISEESWKAMKQIFIPNVLLAKSGDLADKVKDLNYVQEATTMEEQLESADEVVDSVLFLVILLFMAAVVLSIAILYNLGLLNFAEKNREYATQRVLGYHSKDIHKQIFRENALQVAIGLIIGIPVGYKFLAMYVSTVSTSNFEYVAYISISNLLISCMIVVLCSYLTFFVVSRKVKKLDMIASLKSVE